MTAGGRGEREEEGGTETMDTSPPAECRAISVERVSEQDPISQLAQ